MFELNVYREPATFEVGEFLMVAMQLPRVILIRQAARRLYKPDAALRIVVRHTEPLRVGVHLAADAVEKMFGSPNP